MNNGVYILTCVRSPLVVIFSALWTTVLAPLQTLLLPLLTDYWRRFFVSNIWAMGLLKIAGVRLKVSGLEHLPAEGALYLFNHTSHYDIPILFAAIPRALRFGAKKELFKVPFLAMGMRNVKTIPIDRANREQVLKSYRAIYEDVRHRGDSVILAPEGTRQKEEVIGPFKNGPFVFAIECGCPIVPVVLSGASKVLGKKSLWINVGQWITTVKVQVLPPISPSQFSLENMEELKNRVRTQMVNALASLN